MDKDALLSHTGMTAADVELVYEPSKDKLLALAAGQHHRDANIPTLTSYNLLVITLHWLRHEPALTEHPQQQLIDWVQLAMNEASVVVVGVLGIEVRVTRLENERTQLLAEGEKLSACEASVCVEVGCRETSEAGVYCSVWNAVEAVLDESNVTGGRGERGERCIDTSEFQQAEIVHHTTSLVVGGQLLPGGSALVERGYDAVRRCQVATSHGGSSLCHAAIDVSN